MSELVAHSWERIAEVLAERHLVSAGLLLAWLREQCGEAAIVRVERLERDLDQIVMSHSNERDQWIRERDELRAELRAWRDGDLERIDILAEIVAENDRLKAELQMWQNGREATTSMAYDSTPIARLGEACDHLEAAIEACKAPLEGVEPPPSVERYVARLAEPTPGLDAAVSVSNAVGCGATLDDDWPEDPLEAPLKRIETPVARTNGAKPKAKPAMTGPMANALKHPWNHPFSPGDAKYMIAMLAGGSAPWQVARELGMESSVVSEANRAFGTAIGRAKRLRGVERDEYIEGLYQVHLARFEATKGVAA